MGNGKIGKPQHEQRKGGQVGTEAGEGLRELRHHFDQQDAGYHNGHHHHGDRVVHGLLDLGLQGLGLFLVGGHAVEHGLQRTGLLAGFHQIAEQFIKIARVLADGVCEIVAGGHIIAHCAHEFRHGRVLQTVAHNLEGLYQRNAGFHHGGQLTAEDGDVAGSDLLFLRAEEVLGLALDACGNDALLAQLCLHQRLAGPGHFTLGFLAVLVRALPKIDRLVH